VTTTAILPSTEASVTVDNIEFVRAYESDLGEIRDLIARCSRSSILERFHLPISTSPRGYFTDALADRRSHCAFLIREADRTVGFVELHMGVAAGAADIALIIEEASQGQGWGTQALRHIARIAAAEGVTTLLSGRTTRGLSACSNGQARSAVGAVGKRPSCGCL